MELFQHHLASKMPQGKYHSGRGVRVRMLSTSEIDAIQQEAIRCVPKEAPAMSFQMEAAKIAIRRMIVQITKEPHPYGADIDALELWQPIESARMDLDYDKLFTARDDSTLTRVYNMMHGSSSEDEALLGKVI